MWRGFWLWLELLSNIEYGATLLRFRLSVPWVQFVHAVRNWSLSTKKMNHCNCCRSWCWFSWMLPFLSALLWLHWACPFLVPREWGFIAILVWYVGKEKGNRPSPGNFQIFTSSQKRIVLPLLYVARCCLQFHSVSDKYLNQYHLGFSYPGSV